MKSSKQEVLISADAAKAKVLAEVQTCACQGLPRPMMVYESILLKAGSATICPFCLEKPSDRLRGGRRPVPYFTRFPRR